MNFSRFLPAISAIFAAVLLWNTTAQAQPNAAAPPLQSIVAVDIDRYLGVWYEVALIPNKFQSMCLSDTSAEYAKRADGTLSVTNRCKTTGAPAEAVGQAKLADPSNPNTTAKLKVRFAPEWLSWLPMVWANYWVIALDDAPSGAYQWALVGEPNREFLWVLSRSPQVSPNLEATIMARAKALGYDTTKIKKSPQSVR